MKKPQPVLFVLAGVNGAGKSSIGGHLLERQRLSWFNPDSFARELRQLTGCSQKEANAQAWAEGLRRLDEAIATRWSFAFETTLGGTTIPARIAAAAATHDVFVWYCGLESAEAHIARVALRVARGGHDIPADKIRERFATSRENLIALLPRIHTLQVYDNSRQVAVGDAVPDPTLVLDVAQASVEFPRGAAQLARTPDWAKPVVEAALAGF